MNEAEKIVARMDAMTQEEHAAGIAAARARHILRLAGRAEEAVRRAYMDGYLDGRNGADPNPLYGTP